MYNFRIVVLHKAHGWALCTKSGAGGMYHPLERKEARFTLASFHLTKCTDAFCEFKKERSARPAFAFVGAPLRRNARKREARQDRAPAGRAAG